MRAARFGRSPLGVEVAGDPAGPAPDEAALKTKSPGECRAACVRRALVVFRSLALHKSGGNLRQAGERLMRPPRRIMNL
jgi:hypothetical protein